MLLGKGLVVLLLMVANHVGGVLHHSAVNVLEFLVEAGCIDGQSRTAALGMPSFRGVPGGEPTQGHRQIGRDKDPLHGH